MGRLFKYKFELLINIYMYKASMLKCSREKADGLEYRRRLLCILSN